jgi:hypothetical protein
MSMLTLMLILRLVPYLVALIWAARALQTTLVLLCLYLMTASIYLTLATTTPLTRGFLGTGTAILLLIHVIKTARRKPI